MGIGVRRSDMEIIREILQTNGTGITELRYGANLSYTQIQRYLAFMKNSELISLSKNNANSDCFETTSKGRRVLKMLDELIAVLGYSALSEVEPNESKK